MANEVNVIPGSTRGSIAANAMDGASAANVANINVVGGIPLVYRVTATALTGNVDVTVTHKIRVIDVYCVAVGGAGGAADTITVGNGASAITDAIDMNVADVVIVRAATLNDANWDIAAAGTLRVAGASAVTCEVVITAIRVA